MASVREVITVYQPLSFHGTDTGEVKGSEVIQAGVRPTSMVLSGAMPEVLVSAVAASHRLESIGGYDTKENNLLVLCRITLDATVEDGGLFIHFDLKDLSLPEEVEIDARTILKLSIDALKKTLQNYFEDSEGEQKYQILIEGTSEKNHSLKDLSEKGIWKK